MAVILPFEAEFYQRHRIPVTFVGHPLCDGPLGANADRMAEPSDNPNQIGLLPGSRTVEVRRLLPVMLAAVKRLQASDANLRFIVSAAPMLDRNILAAIIKQASAETVVELTSEPVETLFKRCRLVVAASGTVTLQAAIAGVPTVIIYKVSPLSYRLGKALIKVEHAGLINLIAGKTVVPELLQKEASPEKIAATVLDLIQNEVKLKQMRQDLAKASQKLGGPGASRRVADIALNMLGS
jgi:lipid-A-disaccharide synthase